jgi:hypothetical protein
MIYMSKKERPCKTCEHVNDHVGHRTGWFITCTEIKCRCMWYTSMTNLEYLEWLDKQHEKASVRI